MIEIANQGDGVTAAGLAALEKEFGAKLPEDYLEFLSLNDGGRPTPGTVDIEGLPGSPTDVQEFFGMHGASGSSNILWNLEVIRDRLPNFHALPIACDSGGSLFCLTPSQAGKSEVVYCDMPGSSFYKATQDISVYKVAPDFRSFMNKIRNWVH
ncbi:MAG TPA: SMI1/KNR4 family protein [Alphaproteobacteria bacterium]|nr:SMI1/KNR4 family protein [Alphaproteobacteria bacterium]